MLVVSASKTCKILPAVVACLFAVAVMACLVHTDGIDAAPTAHQGHPHTSSPASAPITLDLHCLVAILPAAVGLVWLCLGVLYLSVLWSHPVVPAFPPFIPPKAMAHS